MFGARTLVTANPVFQQYKYVPVRRMALFLEQSLSESLGWVMFEPNDKPLWTAIPRSIEAFMLGSTARARSRARPPATRSRSSATRTTTTAR